MVSANKAKRLINASGKFVLLMIQSQEKQLKVNGQKLHVLHTHHDKHEISTLVKQFFEYLGRLRSYNQR